MQTITKFLTHGVKRLDGLTIEQKRAIVRRAFTSGRPGKEHFVGLAFFMLAMGLIAYGAIACAHISSHLWPGDERSIVPLAATALSAVLLGAAGVWITRRAVQKSLLIELGRWRCPSCGYCIRDAHSDGVSITCPECGHNCNIRVLGLRDEDVHQHALKHSMSLLARFDDWLYLGGVEPYHTCTRVQRAVILKAARRQLTRKRPLEAFVMASGMMFTICLAVSIASVPMLVVTPAWEHGGVSPGAALTTAAALSLLLFVVTLGIGVFCCDRWCVQRILRRGWPLTDCIRCRASLVGLPVEDGCVVCRDCFTMTILELRALTPEDLLPKGPPGAADTTETRHP